MSWIAVISISLGSTSCIKPKLSSSRVPNPICNTDAFIRTPSTKQPASRCDQSIRLTGIHPSEDYPIHLRRVKFYDVKHDKLLVFLTNNFDLPALTIAELYRCRWQVELFFKWIKQHLRIKAFFGTSENAVKSQIWIAISTYVLVAIVKKRIKSDASLYTILQILSLTLFEKTPLIHLLANTEPIPEKSGMANQLNLFTEISGQ